MPFDCFITIIIIIIIAGCASSELSATSKTTALIQTGELHILRNSRGIVLSWKPFSVLTGHVVPMHTKFVDSGHFEGWVVLCGLYKSDAMGA